jgi:hypothetical protein
MQLPTHGELFSTYIPPPRQKPQRRRPQHRSHNRLHLRSRRRQRHHHHYALPISHQPPIDHAAPRRAHFKASPKRPTLNPYRVHTPNAQRLTSQSSSSTGTSPMPRRHSHLELCVESEGLSHAEAFADELSLRVSLSLSQARGLQDR